jgi:diguanylate cyclase (GGDEF)-like protein
VKSHGGSQRTDYAIDIDGKQKWFDASISLLKNEAGEIAGVTAVVRDITERKLAEDNLAREARIDLLTGLSNRRDFTERLIDEIGRFNRNSRAFSIFLADIDRFKRINDSHGHECGDYVLRYIGELMRASLRKHDIVARWGGEEFTALLPETNEPRAKVAAEKVRRAIAARSFSFRDSVLEVTMSIGICSYERAMSAEQLIDMADGRLYEAKASGRNRVI